MNTNLTPEQQELLDFIQQYNNDLVEWRKQDPEHRWIGLLNTNLTHWGEWGVFTKTDLRRHLLISEISDTHKDLYNFRPRYSYNEMSLEELEACLQSLSEACAREFEREEAARAEEMEPLPNSWEDPGFQSSFGSIFLNP